MFILDNNRLTIYFILAYKDAGRTNQNLNNFFLNICDWVVDNKLSIHLGKDETKGLLFSTKHN